MSRTYKDKPSKFKYEPWDKDRVLVRCEAICYDWITKEPREYTAFRYLENKSTKTKKRKEVDTEHHWMNTPSWWNRMKHTRPERRRVTIALSQVSDVEEADIPDLGRKPHIYFW